MSAAGRAAVSAVAGLWLSAALALPAAGQQAPAAQPGAQAALPVTAYPAAEATIESRRDYRLRQGDEVLLTVFGEPTLTPGTPLRVMQGGAVTVPLVGSVPVGGMTTLQASHAIAAQLRKYLREPQVTVALYSVGPVEALILGNVRSPGKYTMPPPARLTDVIAAAGGLGPTDGDFPDARLETPDGKTSQISLQKLLHDGDSAANVALVSGTTVYVPSPNTFNVRVLGAVDKPGDVPLHDGDDLAMAVARAGTSTQQSADLNHVSVTRVGADGKASVQTVDLYGILKRGDLSHDMVLQKNDLVYVPTAPSHNITGAASVLILLRALIP